MVIIPSFLWDKHILIISLQVALSQGFVLIGQGALFFPLDLFCSQAPLCSEQDISSEGNLSKPKDLEKRQVP